MPNGVKNLVNVSSDNGLLPDGTKPLPKSMCAGAELFRFN